MISNYLLFEDSGKFQIYCDMDGVLTDFDRQAENIDRDLKKLPEKEKWEKISDAGVEFWSDMSWMKDGKDLWNYIKKYKLKILTAAPGLSKTDPVKINSIKGKKIWVENNLGKDVLRNLIITVSEEKKKYANSNSILIDDRKDLIDVWNDNSGIGIIHKSAKETIKKLEKILN